jgi:uncharacterized protein
VGRHPFRVPVAVLLRRPGTRQREVRRGPVPDAYITASRLPPRAEVEVDALLESVHGGILVTGTVTAPWEAACRRCLAEVSGRLRSEVRELYSQEADQDEAYLLRGDQLDLEPLARDAVLLELPLVALCREDCLGLCPVCGSNRNDSPCACEPEGGDPRWAALDVLRQADWGRTGTRSS